MIFFCSLKHLIRNRNSMEWEKKLCFESRAEAALHSVNDSKGSKLINYTFLHKKRVFFSLVFTEKSNRVAFIVSAHSPKNEQMCKIYTKRRASDNVVPKDKYTNGIFHVSCARIVFFFFLFFIWRFCFIRFFYFVPFDKNEKKNTNKKEMYLLSIYIASQIKDNAQFLSFYTHYTSDQTSIVFSSLNIRKKELYSNIFVFFLNFKLLLISRNKYIFYTLYNYHMKRIKMNYI